MNGGLPERIDPLHLADHHVRLSGQLPLARFRRLCEPLSDDSGSVTIDAQFGQDETGQRIVHLRSEAQVVFTCQRCMAPMAQALVVDETLGIVGSEAEAERLGGRYEPLMVAATVGGRMLLVEMVEDEMLLQVPMIPRHAADDVCRPAPLAPAAEESAVRENPFAALRALKDGE